MNEEPYRIHEPWDNDLSYRPLATLWTVQDVRQWLHNHGWHCQTDERSQRRIVRGQRMWRENDVMDGFSTGQEQS